MKSVLLTVHAMMLERFFSKMASHCELLVAEVEVAVLTTHQQLFGVL
jgi:hypothetical protein